jgi:UDP-glucose 4-epimerase
MIVVDGYAADAPVAASRKLVVRVVVDPRLGFPPVMSADTGPFAPELAEAFRGKRVLITGGLGFIGSTLARELVSAGSSVVVVDSLIPEYGGSLANVAGIEDRLTINISDVRDEYSMRYLVKGQDFLFNLAGQTSHLDSMENPFTDLEINCRSQLSILEACRRHNPEVRIVFASTRQIYGRPQYVPVDERHPLSPVDVNGINKTAGEWYHLLYGEVYGIPVCVLRLTNTYGPRMRVKDARQTFLGFWFRQLIEGEALVVFGDGTQRRDFNYVDDAVRACLLAAARDDAIGRAYNLGHDEVSSLVELAELLIRVGGGGRYRLAPFPADRKAIDIGDYYSDYSSIREELGWSPTVTLEEGVGRSLDFFRRHRSHYWDDA